MRLFANLQSLCAAIVRKFSNRLGKFSHSFATTSRRLKWEQFLAVKSKQHQRSNKFTLDDLGRPSVINLPWRKDRLFDVQSELRKIAINDWDVFSGIYARPGALGCGWSHYFLLKSQLGSTAPIWICEDDIEFLAPANEIFATISEFLADDFLDVLCLGNNVVATPSPYSDRLLISNEVQTTSCYIAKPRAIDLLFDSFGESIDHLAEGKAASLWAIDIHWKAIQSESLIFAVPTTQLVHQKVSWSDIEDRSSNFASLERLAIGSPYRTRGEQNA